MRLNDTLTNKAMKYFEIYNVEMNEETNILKITKDSKRARFGVKMVVHLRFRSTEAMHEYFVKTWVASMEKQQAYEKAKAAAKASAVNPFKVGDLMYDSWGYDQTNIDFFQVVEVGKKSVKVRKISQNYVKSAGMDCEYVSPAVDQFISEPILKMVKVYVGDQTGTVSICIGGLMKYTQGEKGVYQSHYA